MQVSLNEVEVMSAKAACGAGRPWGLAQEVGWAVASLHAMGHDGARACLRLLKLTDSVAMDELRPLDVTKDVWTAKRSLCPVLTGAYISDLDGIDRDLTLKNVYVPSLLIPFSMLIGLEGDLDADICATLRLYPVEEGFHWPAPQPVDIDDEIWEALGAFAHRTYVPASEASRLKGAGAGLTDND